MSEVIVATNGKISETAKERICKEFNQTIIQFFDLAKLVDLFTEYYPRVFFGGWEYDYLTMQINALDRVQVFADRDRSLCQLFVAPKLQRIAVSPNGAGSFSATNEKLKFKDLPPLIKRVRKVALVGEAGCGKSTILKKLAIDAIRSYRDNLSEETNENRAISLFCEARSLLDCDPDRALLEFLRERAECPSIVNVDTLLVDGLDEVSLEKRKEIIESLEAVCSKYDIGIVLSSRCEDFFQTRDWCTYEIAPMNVGQALALCEKAVSDESIIGPFKNSIDEIRKRIALTPLAIFLLLEIIEERQEVPASLTELYDQYVDNVLGKHDKEKGIESLFQYELKKRFLASLSGSLMVGDHSDSITLDQFEEHGRQFFEDYEWPWSDWASLLDELKRSSLLLIDEQGGRLGFRHRSFLEFFAAYNLYVNDQGNESTSSAINYYFDPQWSDVAFYYFGLKKSISTTIIDRILAIGGEKPFDLIQKMRLGRLLQACWHSKADVKKHGLIMSCQYASKIHEAFVCDIQLENQGIPLIFADFILISIASDSYRSVFLKNQIKLILDKSPLDNEEMLLGALCLFSAAAPYFDEKTQIEISERLINEIQRQQDRQLEGRGFFYLLMAAGSEKNVQKMINRRLKKYVRRYGSVLRGLLPEMKKGD